MAAFLSFVKSGGWIFNQGSCDQVLRSRGHRVRSLPVPILSQDNHNQERNHAEN